MAIQSNNQSAPFGAITTHNVITAVENVFASVNMWNLRRKTQNELFKLSNKELDDIGLTRGDIPALVAKMSR